MKKLRFFDLIIIVSLSLPFSYLGCGGGGGGGGGGEDNPVPRTFHLDDDGELIPGYSISFSLNGSSSAGDNFTCFLAIETRDITTIDNTSVIPQEVYMEMTNTNTGVTITDISTAYYNFISHDPVKRIIQPSDIEYTPIKISEIPSLAEIGDFGTLTSYLGSDGSTTTGTWRLENAGGGLANLIESTIDKKPNGDISSTGKATIKIDESGDPLNFSLEFYYPDTEITVKLSGGRVSEGDDVDRGTAPTISSVKLFKIVDDVPIETLSYDIGDMANMILFANDPDLNMYNLFISEFLLPDLASPFIPNVEMILPPQIDPNMEYFFIEPTEVNGPAGNWRECFWIVDNAGNESNEFCVNIIINEAAAPAANLNKSLAPKGVFSFSNKTIAGDAGE